MNKTALIVWNHLKMFTGIAKQNHLLSVLLISLLLIAVCLYICLSFPVYPSFEKRTEDFSEIDQKAVIDDLDSVLDIDRYYIMSSRFRKALVTDDDTFCDMVLLDECAVRCSIQHIAGTAL